MKRGLVLFVGAALGTGGAGLLAAGYGAAGVLLCLLAAASVAIALRVTWTLEDDDALEAPRLSRPET